MYNSNVAVKVKFKYVATPLLQFFFQSENNTQSSECCLCQL